MNAEAGLTLYGNASIEANQNNITDLNKLNFSSQSLSQINNFFDQSKCDSDEAIKTVYPNGSYSCNTISSTTGTEGLAETLAAGNFADGQSILMNGSTEINMTGGNITNLGKLTLSEGASDFRLRVGGEEFLDDGFEDGDLSPFQNDANNDVDWSISSSAASGSYSAEAGDPFNKDDNSELEVAVPDGRQVVFDYYLQRGGDAATFEVAGGNSYYLDDTGGKWVTRAFELPAGSKTLEWRLHGLFGTTSSDSTYRIDNVRVFNTTEDAVSLYGSLQMNTGEIRQVDRVNFVQGVQVGTDTSASGVEDTAVGRKAQTSNKGTAVGYSSNVKSREGTAMGYETTVDGRKGVAVGHKASVLDDWGVAIGDKSNATGSGAIVLGTESCNGCSGAEATADEAMALGTQATASGTGSVAIGAYSEATKSYEATFGNLNGDELDVEVTGNMTVHGSGGINVTDGNVTADNFVSRSGDIAEIYSAEEDYSPGTVVSVSEGEAEVEETSKEFEDAAGVVSTEPGFVLNQEEEGVKVALEGRVPVKVEGYVDKGDELAASSNGKAVACETSDIELGEDADRTEIIDAFNSMSDSRDCLEASFGRALESGSGKVEVMLD